MYVFICIKSITNTNKKKKMQVKIMYSYTKYHLYKLY